MSVLIIDYGMGNLGSVKRSFEECGADTFISDEPADLRLATHIVLPGVGAFRDGMANLLKMGWVSAIKKAVLDDGIPILGICLGMQLFAEKGYEGGEHSGLGLINGEVIPLEADSPETRIPHVGWNEVHIEDGNPLFSGLDNRTDFYFVHSYHLKPLDQTNVIATTPYCGNFVAGIMSDNVFGVQFHPEKSSHPGFQIIKNFLGVRG